jgi:hypothetical protein
MNKGIGQVAVILSTKHRMIVLPHCNRSASLQRMFFFPAVPANPVWCHFARLLVTKIIEING